jgi:hypothetical protein
MLRKDGAPGRGWISALPQMPDCSAGPATDSKAAPEETACWLDHAFSSGG